MTVILLVDQSRSFHGVNTLAPKTTCLFPFRFRCSVVNSFDHKLATILRLSHFVEHPLPALKHVYCGHSFIAIPVSAVATPADWDCALNRHPRFCWPLWSPHRRSGSGV